MLYQKPIRLISCSKLPLIRRATSLYLNPDLWPPLRGDDWWELDQFLKLAWRQGSWEVITLKAVPRPSSRWGVCGLWPSEPAATITSRRWGQERGSLLLRGLGPASGQLRQGPRHSAWRGFQPVPGGTPDRLRSPKDRNGPRETAAIHLSAGRTAESWLVAERDLWPRGWVSCQQSSVNCRVLTVNR